MIVCLCNRISDKSISEAACSGMCRTAGEVYRCLGCRVQCGKCVPELRRLFHEARAIAQASQGAADLQDRTGCDAVCAAAQACQAGESARHGRADDHPHVQPAPGPTRRDRAA